MSIKSSLKNQLLFGFNTRSKPIVLHVKRFKHNFSILKHVTMNHHLVICTDLRLPVMRLQEA